MLGAADEEVAASSGDDWPQVVAKPRVQNRDERGQPVEAQTLEGAPLETRSVD
jgi:hypothetical protein